MHPLLFVCALCLSAAQFPPSDVMILGDIDYGQTSPPLDCPAEPKYCALVFNGSGGDKVQVTVTGATGKTYIAVADGTLKELASGSDKLVFTLPAGPEPVTYYAIFRDEGGKSGRFAVDLKKLSD